MWLQVARAYNGLLMPVLMWVILSVLISILGCTARIVAPRCLIWMGSTYLRRVCALCIPWCIHFLVLWFLMVRLSGFAWGWVSHYTPEELDDFWRIVTRACSEMALVSTLMLVIYTFSLVAALPEYSNGASHR